MKVIVLTDKAIRELLLAIRGTRRSTEVKRAYLRKLKKKLEGKLQEKGR